MNVTGLVLAGGQSRRMGQNKALMQIEGQTLVARVLERLSSVCDELIVSANDVALYAHLDVPIVPDVIRGRGALSGIHAGLSAMRNAYALVVACDMPFVNPELLRHLAELAPGYDVVVPRLAGEFEPLHAVYGRTCVAPIERLVADRPRRVTRLYEQVRVREVDEDIVRHLDPELRSFININTPDDWRHIRRFLGQ